MHYYFYHSSSSRTTLICIIIHSNGVSSSTKNEETSIYLHYLLSLFHSKALLLSVPRKKKISFIVDGKERERAKVSLFHNKIVVRLARGVPQCVGLASIREGCTTRGGAGRGKRKRGFSLSHGGEAGCVNRAHTKRTHAPRHCACPLV